MKESLPEAIVAVVMDGSCILMIRRSPNGSDGGYWCPLSGKMESGESQEAAVIREVAEEVGLTVSPVRKVWESISHGKTHRLHWWLAKANGRALVLNPREVSAARWLQTEEILRLEPTFPGDRDFFAQGLAQL